MTLWIFLDNIIVWATSILHFKGHCMRNLQYEIRIYQKVIIKSQRQFMYGSNFYGSEVIILTRYEISQWTEIKKSIQKLFKKLRPKSKIDGFLNNTVYLGTLICSFSKKSLLPLQGFLLTRLFFQSLKKQHKQMTPVKKREPTKKKSSSILELTQRFKLYHGLQALVIQIGSTKILKLEVGK